MLFGVVPRVSVNYFLAVFMAFRLIRSSHGNHSQLLSFFNPLTHSHLDAAWTGRIIYFRPSRAFSCIRALDKRWESVLSPSLGPWRRFLLLFSLFKANTFRPKSSQTNFVGISSIKYMCSALILFMVIVSIFAVDHSFLL